MIHIERLGIYLSKPVAFVLVLIYLVQSALLVYLVTDKFDLQKQINYQQTRIGELEEKLRLYKAIEDLQIGFNKDEVNRLSGTIYTESKKYGYDPLFVVAIILSESSFKKDQVSDSGAAGLMQLMPALGKAMAPGAGVQWQGPATLHQPDANIKMGTLYLFEQILKYGDIKKALVAYSQGEGKLNSILKANQPLPHEYFEKVMNTYKRLKQEYPV